MIRNSRSIFTLDVLFLEDNKVRSNLLGLTVYIYTYRIEKEL